LTDGKRYKVYGIGCKVYGGRYTVYGVISCRLFRLLIYFIHHPFTSFTRVTENTAFVFSFNREVRIEGELAIDA